MTSMAFCIDKEAIWWLSRNHSKINGILKCLFGSYSVSHNFLTIGALHHLTLQILTSFLPWGKLLEEKQQVPAVDLNACVLWSFRRPVCRISICLNHKRMSLLGIQTSLQVFKWHDDVDMTIWTLAVWQRIYAIYVSKQSSKSIVNQHVVSHLSTYHKINPNSHKSLHPFKTASCFFSTKKDTLRIYKNNPQNSNQQIRPYVHLLRAKPTGETALHFFSGWKMICFFFPEKTWYGPLPL